MSITAALQTIVTHREVVPVYYHRGSQKWIVGGINGTNGGAVIVSDSGEIVAAHASKRDALATLNHE